MKETNHQSLVVFIGCGHPVGASSVRMLLDLYKKVTGTAGDYQVSGTKNGMMFNIGELATTNYVYVVGISKTVCVGE